MIIDKKDISKKDDLVTMLLCLLLSRFGAHRFYVGRYFTGLLWLVFNNIGLVLHYVGKVVEIPAAWDFGTRLACLLAVILTKIIDVYAIYSESFTDGKGRIVASRATKEQVGIFPDKTLRRLYALLIVLAFALIELVLIATR